VAHLDAPQPILTEVSGGVSVDTIGAYAAAGPDRISVGALTHSAPGFDFGLDLVWTNAPDTTRNEGKN
jgi:nicotinate-nucleotide pyrophosphorylase (carboxylating)